MGTAGASGPEALFTAKRLTVTGPGEVDTGVSLTKSGEPVPVNMENLGFFFLLGSFKDLLASKFLLGFLLFCEAIAMK